MKKILVWDISLAMVTGKKLGKPEDAISSPNIAWGVFVFLVCGLWIAALFAGYNSRAATVKLPGIGLTVNLGENESSDDGHEHRSRDSVIAAKARATAV